MTTNTTVSSPAIMAAPISSLQTSIEGSEHNQIRAIEKENTSQPQISVINSSESSLDLKKVVAGNLQDSRDISNIKPNNPASSPVCRNCNTSTTPLWRRDEQGSVLCNACGLFLKLHGRPRPISLKTDVIKSRNRKSNHHDSPNEKKRKDTGNISFANNVKKKKTEQSQQNVQSSTSQNTQNGASINQIEDSKYAKILPKNGPTKADSLPHLSSLLADPSPIQKTTEYPISISQPASAVNISSPQLASLQRVPPHLASINEILSTKRPRHAHPQSLASYQQSGVVSPAENGITSPAMAPIVSSTGPLAQVMLNHVHSAVSSPGQQQITSNNDAKHSHFSASPPPMELQQAISHTNSSTSSNKTHPQHQEAECIREPEPQNIMIDTQLANNALGFDRNGMTQQLHQGTKPSLAVTLQTQEEEIKLRTRISELELVTDLYKRHIFELDAKCATLEKELFAIRSSQQQQHQQH